MACHVAFLLRRQNHWGLLAIYESIEGALGRRGGKARSSIGNYNVLYIYIYIYIYMGFTGSFLGVGVDSDWPARRFARSFG